MNGTHQFHSDRPEAVDFKSLEVICSDVTAAWYDLKVLLHEVGSTGDLNENNGKELRRLMLALYGELDDSAEFIYAMHLANSKPRYNHPWLWQPLAQDQALQLDLLTYFADYPTPIYDSPKQAAASLVLHGQLRLHHYHMSGSGLSPHYPISKLQESVSWDCRAHDAFCHSGIQENIEDVEAVSGRCVVMRAALRSSNQSVSSHWYFPISAQSNGSFFAQRLKRNA